MNDHLFQLLKIALPTLALIYVVLSPAVAMSLWNNLLFYPTRGDHDNYRIASIENAPRQDVSIKSSHQSTLHGWFFKLPGAQKVAIINHGNGGSIVHRIYLIQTLLRSDVSVLAYDYQGYGKSTGSPSVPKICDDGNAAYAFAIDVLGYKPQEIILVGESLGCGVTTEVARHRECAAVILQSGFASLPKIAGEKFGLLKLYPGFLFPRPNLDNTANLREIHVPVLIVHGDRDCVIPAHHGKTNFQAANEPKTLHLIPSAGHNDCIDIGGAAYQEAYAQFIRSLEQKHLASAER